MARLEMCCRTCGCLGCPGNSCLAALGMLYTRIDGEKRKAKCFDVTVVAVGETLVPSVMDALDGILRASGVWPV
jgi:hypothetical protein